MTEISAEDRASVIYSSLYDDTDTFLSVLTEQIRQAEQAARLSFANSLFAQIEHGDDDHRAWLKKAVMDHCEGRPVERPVGLGAVEAARLDEREKALKAAARIAHKRGANSTDPRETSAAFRIEHDIKAKA